MADRSEADRSEADRYNASDAERTEFLITQGIG